jgi:uncharacterized protein YdeI (YjbR/CyaY-like superfamily)
VPSAKPTSFLTFETPAALDAWLLRHHAKESELWVRLYKKGSSIPSVDWNDCVLAALIWGWIDGQKQSLDEVSFLQRLTPRRARSSWSKRNCEHAERLIKEGRMQPPGLVQVEQAKADGRFEQAYAGSADMVLPADFLQSVSENRAAQVTFDTLNRANLFAIYYRLHSAKRLETRAKRMSDMIAKLAQGRPIL